jgi:hypothetical protein
MAENNTPPIEIPPLLVQRMGKKFRIVYKENRNLAKFNSGEPVDDGGFQTLEDAQIHMSKVTAGFKTSDPEEENVA